MYLASDAELLVASVGGLMVGMGAYRRVDRATAEIKRMRVAPAWQSRGLGRMISGGLERSAGERGCCGRLVLDTTEQQQAALHLYESCGYRVYSEISVAGLRSLLLGKHLGVPAELFIAGRRTARVGRWPTSRPGRTFSTVWSVFVSLS